MKMSEPSRQTGSAQTELFAMSSAGDSPARTSLSRKESLALAWTASAAAFGASTPVLFANFDRNSSSWKTCQGCLVSGLQTFSETWPRAGMMRSGRLYRLPQLAPRTSEIGSGWLATPTETGNQISPSMMKWPGCRAWLPTATARDYRSGRASAATMARNARPLSETIGGLLNPQFVEWLMGYPQGHTEPTDCGPSAMPSSPKSRKSSAKR